MSRSRWSLTGLAICGLGVLVYLNIEHPGVEADFVKTEGLATWGVALGTLGLAIATFQVARRAREEAEAVRREAEQVAEQITLQREQMDASVRPHVYPFQPDDWVMGSGFWSGNRLSMLPIQNAGPGLALNVRGRIVWNLAPGQWRSTGIYAGTIAAGHSVNGRLTSPGASWPGARGYVRYTDLAGDDWLTYFSFELGEGNHLDGRHKPPVRVSDTDPDLVPDPAEIAAQARPE